MVSRKIDIKKLVIEELDRTGRSWYWLGRHPDVTCHEDSVRAWLQRGTQLGADHVSEVLNVLGFKITRPAKSRK